MQQASAKLLADVLPLQFDNRILRQLPIERPADPTVPRLVADACFSVVKPTPLIRPTLVAVAPSALNLLGIHAGSADPAALAPDLRQCITDVFSGNTVAPGSEPLAHCYCGYQFGSFAGQLGDGAAMLLGEVVCGGARWEVQLKGAGPTPYSRQFDGRKVLRSSIREFLASEYMHHLGIPTTRAAALTQSESTVARDPRYSGRTIQERCSVVTRVAQSFLRFGSFEVCRKGTSMHDRDGPSSHNTGVVSSLIDYAVQSYFAPVVASVRHSHVSGDGAGSLDFKRASLIAVYENVVRRTASLVALWQVHGFCHGVLNTDNMSLLGLTIDYGPYAFMSYYDRNFVSNLSDAAGRYAFGQQPAVTLWNLHRLAEAFAAAYPDIEGALKQTADAVYMPLVAEVHREMTLRKLGFDCESVSPEHSRLVALLLETLEATHASTHHVFWQLERDFPLSGVFWDVGGQEAARRALVEGRVAELAQSIAALCCAPHSYVIAAHKRRLSKLLPQVPKSQIGPLQQLLKEQPAAACKVFRGASTNDVEAFLTTELQRWDAYESAVSNYDTLCKTSAESWREKNVSLWTTFVAAYAEQLQRQTVTAQDAARRRALMLQHQPRFVLFPWIIDDVVQKAERGDMTLLHDLCDRITRPYSRDDRDGVRWSSDVPVEPDVFLCSCSS